MTLQQRFETYFNQYQDMVHSLCLGYSKGDRDLTNDLVQETFIKIWGALPKFEERSTPKTWIYRICVNTCLLHIRKTKNKQTETLATNHSDIVEEPSKDKNYHELYWAIGQLKELDRIIIMLVLDELPYEEIAEITGLTEGNLRVKISRAKQKLNKLLSNHGR
ncbi:RNA polymerase sigma factor [Marinoscillum sp.]|uniref:RNA polymerase sigma factor n=1 Tax=Marinoscillum sp. TaxID=2024838 RepID=UPI003BAC396F